MTAFHLDAFLSGHVFAFVFIFSRMGSMLMLFPGIGEAYVPARIRLMFAFLITLLLLEPMYSKIPAPPQDLAKLTAFIGCEVIIGIFYGTFLRILMDVVETTGSIVAIQMGLSNATILNPTFGVQSALPSAFLGVTGLVLLFITGMDHFLLKSLVATYELFPPGHALAPGDMTQTIIHTCSQSFIIGIELSMPFIVIGLLMYAALALMQRIMPQIQLFLVILPVQIWGGFILLSLTMGSIMSLWLHYFGDTVKSFFSV